MSTLFLRTLRDDPVDAELPSHRLLTRAGYIRRAAPGGFTWLPLGWMVYRNVEAIVHDEMNAAGFQEVHFPALLPRAPYEASNRWTEYGDAMFRLKDRRGNDFLFAPTHEEMFTLLVKDLYSSYKDLPLVIYQIQTKYRDEPRPRAGLLRGREFVMKDSYSFDVDDDGLAVSYQRHRDAYIKTFERLGMPFVIVSAMSGAMGGSASEEFLAPIQNGEDTFVRCPSCGFAANVEAVRIPPTPAHQSTAWPPPSSMTRPTPRRSPRLSTSSTPRRPRPAGPAVDCGRHAEERRCHPPPSRRNPRTVGDRRSRRPRRRHQAARGRRAPRRGQPFGEDDFARPPDARQGLHRPRRPGESSPSGIRFLVDPRVATGTSWITGADAEGRHVIGLVAGRDFTPDGTIDVAIVEAGDPCPTCGNALETARGVEIGHIFQLGRRYAEALDLQVLDADGKEVTVTMGSYGIGVSRAVAAIAELTCDELGLCWPRPSPPPTFTS